VIKPIRMEGPVGAKTVIDGRQFDYFSGTGYLGLQNHPAVVQAAFDALQRYGISTATSRGSYGEHPIYDELEKQARAFLNCERIVYFPSGYMGIAVLTQAEGQNNDHIFIDSAAHFSLWDAANATNKSITPFRHRDPAHLQDVIKNELEPGERPIILSDGIFPISGEIAPLPDYLKIVQEFDGSIYLDDAHALGVLGENGWGTPDYFKIDDDICRTSATLAKALGGYGGVIWGQADWVESLERNSSICIGASPPPLVVAAASAAGLKVAKENPGLRENLRKNVAQARSGMNGLGLEVEITPSPILCLPAGKDINLLKVKTGLFEAGIAVSLVRSYSSTPPGGALRIAIFATHTSEQIDRLISTIKRLI
jgi:8-amino-7-oxononanoate synthase